jgi:cytochrome c oxidase subunit 3
LNRYREQQTGALNMNAAATPGSKPYYYVPQPSHWPITGSCALLLLALGATCWVNSISFWPWLVGAGFLVLLVMLFGWFGTVIGESGGSTKEGRLVVPLGNELVHLQ